MIKESKAVPESALDKMTAVLQESTLDFSQHLGSSTALWHCMEFIAQYLQVDLKRPIEQSKPIHLNQLLINICEDSFLQFRQIELSDSWWEEDVGAILGFYEAYEHPAAIIPKTFDRYLLIVPTKNIRTIISKKIASQILQNAYMFYRSLPDQPLKLRDITKFSFKNMRADATRIFLMQGLMIILGLFVPIATGIIFDQVIPNASQTILLQFTIALIVNVVVITLFDITMLISIMRIRLKITASLQAAVWERLIHLPLSFFRKFTAGDLATRASGIDSIQQIITSSVFTVVSSGVLSLLSLFLMLYYSPLLTLGTICLILVISIITIFANILQLKYIRKNLFLQGKLTGLFLQFITSIAKIKMTNSAARAFLRWTEIFSNKNRMGYKSGNIIVNMTLFTGAFSIISTITFFSLVFILGNKLSFGNFITFNAIFGQFFIAILSMVGVITSALTILPLYERIKPILETQPEIRQAGLNPGILTGKIDFIHVAFRYSEDTPVVFKNLTIAVKPGELVAIVGASGCGKSTLFRLLLGFERPDSGKIYYSDLESENLDIRKIRQQIGVVLQDSVLFSGTILENIVGSNSQYTLEEVQEIIRNVGFEEELNEMPMGLQTIVTEQGKTLSGGQRQRLLLARALLKRPQLLLLDEATSALDNLTQEKIYQYLSSIDITCIVIAHRPSTLKYSDKIYLLENGSVAESGSFAELLAKNGQFAELIQRQS